MFRYTCTNYGMFHHMRVDGGKEFYLSLGMQEIYWNLRSRQDISCYQQTQSKQVIFFLYYYPLPNCGFLLFLTKRHFPGFLFSKILT